MEIVEGVVDYGTAPEIVVSGVAYVERISHGQVRVTYFSVHRTPGGHVERRIAVHHVWDWVTWLGMIEVYSRVRHAIANNVFTIDADVTRN